MQWSVTLYALPRNIEHYLKCLYCLLLVCSYWIYGALSIFFTYCRISIPKSAWHKIILNNYFLHVRKDEWISCGFHTQSIPYIISIICGKRILNLCSLEFLKQGYGKVADRWWGERAWWTKAMLKERWSGLRWSSMKEIAGTSREAGQRPRH